MYTLVFNIEEENKQKLIELLKGFNPIELSGKIHVTEFSNCEKECKETISRIENLIECEGVAFFDESDMEEKGDLYEYYGVKQSDFY